MTSHSEWLKILNAKVVGPEGIQEELQEKITQFLATLPTDDGTEWYDTYRGFGEGVLNAFLWWLYPELKPENLLPWQEFPPKGREV